MSISAEVICVGTELLLGEILNGNAQYLAQELAMLGIPHFYQTVVGDNTARLQKVLAIAAGRSQVIITTGGLGPTPDDLTTAAIADFFGVPLVEHPEVWEDIQRKYTARRRDVIPASNRKQALLPEGAAVLPNLVGTAPGIVWEPQPGLLVMTFPGVPSEMKVMWRETAVPLLRSKGWAREVFYSQVLLYWGISESALAERVQKFFESSNPTVAPYANYGQARLRVTARASSEKEAKALIEPVVAQIRQLTGDDCYGTDDDTLASVIGGLLRDRGQTLAIAESCTGGWLGEMLTAVPGSSSYFLGGVICYSNAVKESLLGVSSAALREYGAVSDPVARQMATGVRANLGSDWSLSITGIAGPEGGSPTKPVGLVYIGLATPDGSTFCYEHHFGSNTSREWIRRASVCSALDHLRRRFVMMSP